MRKRKGNLFNRFNKAKKVTKSNIYIPDQICDIPRDDLSGEYNYSTVELFNILGLHRVQMSFEMDYHDWYIFSNSELYCRLIEYLEELQKRGSLNGLEEEVGGMEITIKTEPKEIADLVSALQGQQEHNEFSVKAVLDSQEILKAIRDMNATFKEE